VNIVDDVNLLAANGGKCTCPGGQSYYVGLNAAKDHQSGCKGGRFNTWADLGLTYNDDKPGEHFGVRCGKWSMSHKGSHNFMEHHHQEFKKKVEKFHRKHTVEMKTWRANVQSYNTKMRQIRQKME